MAVLSDPERLAVAKAYMEDERTSHGAVLRSDIVAAVNALDDFFNTNATAINNALPTATKNNLTVSQKSRLVRYVIAKRYG